MKPADLLDPETLPDDLRWLVTEFKLQPKDPALLLIAWHWHRVQEAEDRLRTATVELKTAVDHRIEAMEETAETVSVLTELLAQVQAALEQKPLTLAKQLEQELRQPVSAAVAEVRALQKSVQPLVQTARSAHQQVAIAAFAVGVTLGAVLTAWFLPR